LTEINNSYENEGDSMEMMKMLSFTFIRLNLQTIQNCLVKMKRSKKHR